MPAELPSFLYRAKARDGSLLYVGVTRNPALRIGQHAADKSWWLSEVDDVTVEMHPDRRSALEAEAQAIKTEAPKYNVMHSETNRPRPPSPRPSERPPSGGPVFTARAVRWQAYWELHITDTDGAEVGVTQCRGLKRADATARDYIATICDLEPDAFDVKVVPDLGEIVAEVEQARDTQRAIEQRSRDVAARYRALARRLRAEGWAGSDIALLLGVSEQRVSQLVNAS